MGSVRENLVEIARKRGDRIVDTEFKEMFEFFDKTIHLKGTQEQRCEANHTAFMCVEYLIEYFLANGTDLLRMKREGEEFDVRISPKNHKNMMFNVTNRGV